MKKKTYNEIIDNIPVSKGYDRGYKCRIIITGTFLLSCHGLIDSFEDIDILVVDASDGWWSELLSNDRYDVKMYDGYKSIKVEVGDYTYNIIRDDYYREETVLFADCNEEIELDTLEHALKAKARLKREKDAVHFQTINDNLANWIAL